MVGCSTLLRGWLEAGHPRRGWNGGRRQRGTPQGAVISPLLANIYLHPLDELMATLGYRMVRYADDFVVLCGQPRGGRSRAWRRSAAG